MEQDKHTLPSQSDSRLKCIICKDTDDFCQIIQITNRGSALCEDCMEIQEGMHGCKFKLTSKTTAIQLR